MAIKHILKKQRFEIRLDIPADTHKKVMEITDYHNMSFGALFRMEIIRIIDNEHNAICLSQQKWQEWEEKRAAKKQP
jgi:hypothetical protein